MGRIEKTVFISYRRTNSPWAHAIYQYLTSHDFDSFFDFQSINSGDFSRIILENIKARAHFIFILTPSTLERCEDPNDWLRQEIEIALDEKRNIVPLFLEDFNFSEPTLNKYLTGRLEALKNYNGLRDHSDYFEEAMQRLCNRYLNIPLDAVLHPISQSAQKATNEQKRIANKKLAVKPEELNAQEWAAKGYKTRDYEEQIYFYTESIPLDPTFALAYYNRGIAREKKGDLDGAIRDYAEADRLKPDNIEAYKNSAFFEDIQEYYEDDLFKHESGRLHWLRGETRCEEGDFDGAITDYNEAIRLRPDFTHIYLRRGIAYRRKGDLDRAIVDYSKAIDIEPDDAAAYYERGITQQFKGELNNALEDFTKALFIKPDHAMARMALFSLLRKLGREVEAREHEQILSILILKEDEYNRGCFEAICGNTDKALELLKVGLKKGQSSKKWARQDPDFENIRDDPRFKELVGE